MLSPDTRLHRREDFTLAIRAGRRISGRGLVLHLHPGASDGQPRVGFIVGRGVGSAVDRNLVRRRLRHLMRDRLDRCPPGARLVIRATPAAAGARYDTLSRVVDGVLERAGLTAATR